MIKGRVLRTLTHAAALLAVALLAWAAVRSTVMQAEAATPWGMAPICSAGDAGGHDADPRQAALAACSFCMAAAHVPLQAAVHPVPTPVCIRWVPARVRAIVFPRQPQAPRPRARGPPIPSDDL